MSKSIQKVLPLDSFDISRRLTFKKLSKVNNPNSIHGLYPYRGKISAIDAQQIIHQLPHKGTLLDPFCGSGTIIYEAQQWGLTAIGVDLNPLAIILSKAKTQPLNITSTLRSTKEIIKNAKNLSEVKPMPEWAKKFFHPKTAEEIMRVYKFKKDMSIYQVAAFYGAIALTARACNHYKWSSTSMGKIINPLVYVNFYEKFFLKVKKHIKYVNGNKPAKIIQYDARKLTDVIEKRSIDFVYTSPPYFDALDYTSYYARLIYEIDDDFDRRLIRKNLIQRFSSYAEDMRKVLSEIKKVTKKGALIIFVVGDKKIKNKIINGGKFFSELTDWKPLYIVEREYTGTSSQIWDKINKTKRKEQIIVWVND